MSKDKQTTLLYFGINQGSSDFSRLRKMRPSAFKNIGMLFSYAIIAEQKHENKWLMERLKETDEK